MSAIADRDFPAVPSLRAEWVPVYLEPIMKSGERITVGIAAIPSIGEPIVVSALREESVKCAFGVNGITLMQSAELCLDTLKEYLQGHRSFEAWSAPFHGVELGPKRIGAGETLTDIVRMALRMTACFSALEPGAEDRVLEEQAAEGEDRWPKQIRAAVQNRKPGLILNFGKTFRIVQGGTDTRFDYLGSRYAAFFGKVIPIARNKNVIIKESRAKLWALTRLRDSSNTLSIPAYELILGTPRDDDLAYTEAQIKLMHEVLTELREEGAKEDIPTVPVFTAEEAGNRIILKEAA
jgi:hypothetical protein